jgi:hypothetical protein
LSEVVHLPELLADMQPELAENRYLFLALPAGSDPQALTAEAFAVVREQEATTLVLRERLARRAGVQGAGPFARITLKVHSSLAAVGLTAAVAQALAAKGIPANVVAGFFHDHVFVPPDRGEEALRILVRLQRDASG